MKLVPEVRRYEDRQERLEKGKLAWVGDVNKFFLKNMVNLVDTVNKYV